MKGQITMTFDPETGTVEYFGDVAPLNIPVIPLRKRRVSEILPKGLVKRIAFRILRRTFGDVGKVSEWTRQWQGPWVATILATGERSTWNTRADALAWEIEVINGHLPNIDL